MKSKVILTDEIRCAADTRQKQSPQILYNTCSGIYTGPPKYIENSTPPPKMYGWYGVRVN